MTRHYPDLGSASDWLKKIFHAARPIRSTTKIWVMTRYQYAIPPPVSQTSFSGETSGAVAKCKLFFFFFKKKKEKQTKKIGTLVLTQDSNEIQHVLSFALNCAINLSL